MKIFISSPCYDLIDTRAEIKAMIDEMGLEGILSEDPTCSFDIVAFCTFLSPYAARARASIIASRISSLIAP